MTKRVSILILVLSIILSAVNVVSAASPIINTSRANEGIITINYSSEKPLAAIVEKDGKREQYILSKSNKSIPLQLGSGNYEIKALEHSQGNSYKVVEKITINVSISNANSVYLYSINQINFDENEAAIKKAKELTRGLKSDQAKLAAIYTYVISNVKYDDDKVQHLTTNYLPTISDTFSTNKGICYDYASMMAGMLRSLGIPTKLVKGYATGIKEYHAWNEVLINGEWKILDTTADAVYLEAGMKFNMYKTTREYNDVTGTY